MSASVTETMEQLVLPIASTPTDPAIKTISRHFFRLPQISCRSITNLFRHCSEWCKDRLEFFLSHCKIEWQLFVLNWPIIIFGAVYQYVHKIATNIAYYLHQPRETLYDLGFAVLPALTPQQQIVSEYLFFCFMGFIVMFCVSPFVMKSSTKYTVVMITRVLSVLVLAQTLRIITFLSTSLPGPNYHCRPGSPEYAPPTSIQEMFLRLDAFKGCGDLCFSSHTIFVLTFTLCYHKYGDNQWIKILLVLLAIIFGGLVICARKHYTVDIVVAMYTVPLIWTVFDRYYPDCVPDYVSIHNLKIRRGSMDDNTERERQQKGGVSNEMSVRLRGEREPLLSDDDIELNAQQVVVL